MNKTRISYLTHTWSPVVGCTNGCPWCWARRQAKRQKHNCRRCYDFKPHLHPERLDEPLRKREPSVIGVAFMGDLFDPAFSFEDRDAVFGIMEMADRHVFVLLTKRPDEAKCYMPFEVEGEPSPWPKNLVLGVSVEDQASADRLIPELMECKATRRIVSIEPMRGPVNPDHSLRRFRERGFEGAMKIDGIILGGQTGPEAVPTNPDWVRSVRDQCQAAGVPFFFKAWGKHIPKDHRVALVPWMVGSKGRTLDGRTHDELAWTKGGKA